ncbi:hypothetical protein [Actinoplanes sp. G11-F43]|uniref:hypothetical protein n=1 Tax=Actinoplanes sp. G11-F43 TaxID=3424130 RepID=UPI003D359476
MKRLSGLGRNPAAPEDVLISLAAHPAGRHGMARQPTLPDAAVAAILTHSDRDMAVSLRGDRISPAMRRRIAEHPDPVIREGYADFVRDMVDCGVPFGIDALEEVYGRPRTALAGAPDPKVRAVVAQSWHDRPAAVQVELLTDPDPRVRAAASRGRSPGVPPELRDRCLADPATRNIVAQYLPLTIDQFNELISDEEDGDIRSAVAGNPHLTAEMVARLSHLTDPSVCIALAKSRHLDAETRARLYARAEADSVAAKWYFGEPDWLRDAPLAERLTFLDCPDPAFRRVLAAGTDLPAEAWRRLDDDPDPRVRRIAADRPDTPPDVLERLVRTQGNSGPRHPPLVEHPNFPRHRLRALADDPEPHVRRVALEDPSLPVAILERLAADPESSVRIGVAAHPGVTEALLERLLTDPEPGVADVAAANPVLSPDRMRRIVREEIG